LLLRLRLFLRLAGAVAEDLHLAAALLDHDLGGVAVLAGLVLPLPRLQLALDVEEAALGGVVLEELDRRFAPDGDPVPLGLLALLAGVAVAPGLRGGEAQLCRAGAALRLRTSGSAPRKPISWTWFNIVVLRSRAGSPGRRGSIPRSRDLLERGGARPRSPRRGRRRSAGAKRRRSEGPATRLRSRLISEGERPAQVLSDPSRGVTAHGRDLEPLNIPARRC
jgi:hypothetical protein